MKYYLHDSNAFCDEKISELYINYGYEGLGLFYTILEKLSAQEKPIKTLVLKKQLFVGKKLEKCWSFMEQIELIHSNNGETFNKQLLNFSEKYQIKKQKNAERILQWRENQLVANNVTHSESVRNTPKVKLSKVKESKVIVLSENAIANATIKKNLLEERKLKFKDELSPYLQKYGADMLNKFFLYWTESNKTKTKMKFEIEKTFEVNLRLVNWASRDKEFQKNIPQPEPIRKQSTFEELKAKYS